MQQSTRPELQCSTGKKSDYRTGYNPRGLLGAVSQISIPRWVRILLCLWFLALICFMWAAAYSYMNKADAYIPSNAYKYRSFLIREARFEFGLNAPIALFASQIHQESAWRPDVSSPFADGLTQFTPDTAEWIAQIYPDLGHADVFNPKWAIRAMLKYNKHLYKLFPTVTSECDRWAFVLSSYNGGYGWIERDRRIAASNGKDTNLWWDNVELYSSRADWAFKENRGYPRKIIFTHQPHYVADGTNWTGQEVCLQEDSKKEEESVMGVVEVVEEIAETPLIESPVPVVVPEHKPKPTVEKSFWDKIVEWWNS